METVKGKNPLTRLDYPDPDVIRVGDAYYMASTTMYFMPGCVILRSYDLINWEYCAHVYDRLEDAERENLENGNAYGCGMWAPSLRYHDGVFHVVFIANDTHKTYHFTAEKIEGPWKKSYIDGFYHDCSVLFDGGRAYIMYGNRDIYLTELLPDLSGPKPGGLNRLIISDSKKTPLGYEGCHLYRINGRYYAFFIHSLEDRWFRAEACFTADSLDGEWTGGDVITYALDGVNGVAQGGIVDTPDGKWYGVIFADRGAVGRIPNLVPMTFDENGFPKFETPSEDVETVSTRPGHIYAPLTVSDDFCGSSLNGAWEFNHNPKLSAVKTGDGLRLKALYAKTLDLAKNTLTQRALWPRCASEVTVDSKNLCEGGFAGLCALQYRYGGIGVYNTGSGREIRLVVREDGEETVADRLLTTSDQVRLRVEFEFGPGRDYAEFFALIDGRWKKLGRRHRMNFDLRHFTGCRFGLFCYTTGREQGEAKFTDFRYDRLEARGKLMELKDEKSAAFQASLVPTLDPESFIGAKIPEIRKLAKSLSEDEKAEFLESLPHRYYDENVLHAALISGIKDFDDCVEKLGRFLPYIDNWAVCDTLSPGCFSKNKPELLALIRRLMSSEKTYYVRFGLGMLMKHFLDGDFREEYLEEAANVDSEEYYVKMMQAWFFATALAKQWDSAVKYLEVHRLKPWAHNKTIQKATESFRISPEQKEYLRTLKV